MRKPTAAAPAGVKRLSPWLVGALLLLMLAAIALVSLGSGYIAFAPGEILAILKAKLVGGAGLDEIGRAHV